ncbi:hypothetical protein Lal_00017508 [Lupinus albus]|nr:hypothetical protein Lal_00017508 [Lupinus albus]
MWYGEFTRPARCGMENELDLPDVGRGKERVEDDQKPYAAPTGHRDRNFQRSRPLTIPTGGVSTPMCNKCGKLHYGSTCPGSGNGCFHYKELGHIKRFCPKLDRRLNVIHAERARDHGRVDTPSGTGTSGVDDPNLYHSFDTLNGVPTRLNPGDGLARKGKKFPHSLGFGSVIGSLNTCPMWYGEFTRPARCGMENELDLPDVGRGKERVEDDQKPYAAPTGHRDRNFQRSRPLTIPTGGVSTPMCNKCGKLHYGSTCPGSGNGCFHCKELGHIKRFCPKLDRRLNVIHAERARDHGRVDTPSGTGTSGVDDPVRGYCTVAGISLLVLFDSGATHSLYLLNV